MISSLSSASAKIILFGEHAVVYGQPAIAIPLMDIRASATISVQNGLGFPVIEAKDIDTTVRYEKGNKDCAARHFFNAIELFENMVTPVPSSGWRLTVTSKIPFSRGLGSSAAISIAILRALAASQKMELSSQMLVDLSFELEKLHHGTPSGIDNTVISLEKPISFRKEHPPEIIKPSEFFFVVGDTGIGKNTADVVGFVASNYKKNSARFNGIFEEIGRISLEGKALLEKGDLKNLGQLMNKNQLLLKELNVSSLELDQLISAAKNAGSIGAKLCGAGKGGCMVALAGSKQQAEIIAKRLMDSGAVTTFVTRLK